MNSQSIPISIPGWNLAQPAESFKAFADSIRQQARRVIVKDKSHAEMFFFMPLNGQGQLVHWRGDDRDRQATWLRKHIEEHYVYGVVHIVEGWMRLAPRPDDHILKQIMAGEIKVSELNPEHRIETLMVTAQSRDGYSHAWIEETIRLGDGGLALGSCHEFDDFTGRFGKWFV